jgi:hypothetical protein
MARVPPMRVFLIQTAHGLDPSSGGYKANHALLRHLRSEGHDIAQLCYGDDDEIELLADKARAKGIDPSVTASKRTLFAPDGTAHHLGVHTFTDDDGIENLVLCKTDFVKAYPLPDRAKDSNAYLEVPLPRSVPASYPHDAFAFADSG